MVNKVTLIGNVGKDPDTKTVKDNVCVSRFSLATSETYKGKNGEKETKTEWHNIVVWNKLAEIVEKYVKKGQTLYIEGKIAYRSYEKDNQKYYFTEIVCESLKMLGGSDKKENKGSDQAHVDDLNNQPSVVSEPQDLPF